VEKKVESNEFIYCWILSQVLPLKDLELIRKTLIFLACLKKAWVFYKFQKTIAEVVKNLLKPLRIRALKFLLMVNP